MVIYITTNILNNKRYIGKDSKNNPKYIGSGTLLLEDIKKYGRENFKKEILEYCNNNEELHLRESYWIQKYKAVESNDFYNLVDFSAGWNLSKLGIEKYNFIKEKISKGKTGKTPNIKNKEIKNKRISQKTKGKPKPKDFSNKISGPRKPMSEETKQKISNKKIKHSCFNENFAKKHFKSVTKKDKNGNMEEYESIKEASNKTGIKRSNISCCLTNKSKTAGGFQWFYKEN
jgi:group I intron endonuclease